MQDTLVESGKRIPVGISGWLLMPAFALCAQPIGFVYKSMQLLREIGEVTIIWPAMRFDLLAMFMIAVVSWGFFRRRRFTTGLFVAYIVLTWISWAINSGASAQYLDDGIIGLIFHLAVLLPYMVFSKRAAATFVLAPENPLDNFLDVLAKPAVALAGILRRHRWFIILYIIAFFAAMMVLNAAVHSLYNYGNLNQTWKLITG
ncbi:MAG: DUF2569 family protein [Terracidiphilus sp.]